MIEIDCSYGEGGGQIIRTSLALSALVKKPVHLYNIRIKRPNPGLQAQHLTGVKAVAQICNAKIKGAELNSTELTFEPGQIKGGQYSFDIGTAGSVTLVLQALLPAVLHSQKDFEFEIKGGTNVKWSPPIEYFQHVFCDYMSKIGAQINVEVLNYGFYPKGGGSVKVKIKGSKLKPLFLTERGQFEKIVIWSTASLNLKQAKVAERQVIGFKQIFGQTNYDIHELYFKTNSTGSSIHSHAVFSNCKIGAEALGEPGKKAELVGQECAKKLKIELNSNSTVDSHMLDQILPYLGLLGGTVRFRELTSHAKTNIWVIEKFLPVKFEINGDLITCKSF